jgi:hypothetical protein
LFIASKGNISMASNVTGLLEKYEISAGTKISPLMKKSGGE